MPIERLDFDNMHEADLVELLTTKVPEGLRIDYKRDLYGNSDVEKREALKDISCFANASGGHLIIGIEEQNGLPIAIPGISSENPDAVLQRFEQLMRSGIEPRIQGVRMRPIPLDNGAFCLVLRIPRSWYPPHRVSAQNSNRFWIRNSSGAHEASIEELRSLFTLATTALDRARQFRQERLEEIRAQRGSRPLQGNGRLILHIVPLIAVSSSWQIDLAAVEQNQRAFLPIHARNGWSPRFNFEGFINEWPTEGNLGNTQVFRNGILEATRASIVYEHQGVRQVHVVSLEKIVLGILFSYLQGLRNVDVSPPLVVMITLEGVEGAICNVGLNPWPHIRTPPALERSDLFLPECLINEYGTNIDYQRAMKPAFDALWNAADYPSAQTFSEDGQWTENWRRR
jgi:hypothetical protein